MSTDLVVQSTAYSRASLEERRRYTAALAEAGDLLPAQYRGGMVRNPQTQQMVAVGSAGKIMMMAETGDMLGIHPMAALVGVHIIDGKPSLSANLMTGLVRKAGHRLRVSMTGTVEGNDLTATATLVRVDDPDFEFKVVWTLARAKRAGLFPGKDNSNWAKYPEAMLKARATSEIIREGASDVLMGGNVYTPEELGARVDEQGDPIDLTVVPEPSHGGTDVPRETEPAAAPVDKPVDDKPAPLPKDYDWSKAIREVKSVEEARELYKKARAEGILDATVKVGRKNRILGEVLAEVGTAMADAEKAAAEEPAVEATVDETTEGESVPPMDEGDPNVVDAEVVTDGPTDEPTYG